MIVRVALAALLALALVAAAQPAVEHARRTERAAELDAAVDRTADAIAALQRRGDPGETVATAPRRSLSLALPANAELVVSSDPARLEYRLGDGPTNRRSLPIPVVTCGESDRLAGDVTLLYVSTADGPVVVATRGFIRGNGSNPSHACAPSTRPAG